MDTNKVNYKGHYWISKTNKTNSRKCRSKTNKGEMETEVSAWTVWASQQA